MMKIKKDKNNVNEELAQLYDESVSAVKEGEILSGEVIEVHDKEFLVDIGYKSEGVVYKSEFREPEKIEVGDKVEVMLESKEDDSGMVVLSHERAKKLKSWRDIVENKKEGDVIKGVVSRRVRGGFMADVGMPAFLPASLSMMYDHGGPDSMVGEELDFKIVKINIPRKNIVVSRKEIVEEKRKGEKQEILEHLSKGDVVKGIVKNNTDFGAFVDIGGGITGLLHITDLSWGRVNHPDDVVSVGDEIEVKVLDFDKDSLKVSLGLKQTKSNPWDEIEEKYAEGGTVTGKVVNIMPYGVFVELEQGIEGLIHVSEFSWSKKSAKPESRFSVGEEIEAVVLNINKQDQKLSLGIKQLDQDPWEGVEERYQAGNQISGKVTALTDYGAFVELEKGVEGLVHVSDMSWTKKVANPSQIISEGQELKAVVLNVDEGNRRIALGIKQLEDDPWEDIVQRYPVDTECSGTVTNITNFGIFVELEEDLEGLLHVSEINLAPQQRMEELYNPGDSIEVKVIHIDGVQKKIALSQKSLDTKPAGGKNEAEDDSKGTDAPESADSEDSFESVDEERSLSEDSVERKDSSSEEEASSADADAEVEAKEPDEDASEEKDKE